MRGAAVHRFAGRRDPLLVARRLARRADPGRDEDLDLRMCRPQRPHFFGRTDEAVHASFDGELGESENLLERLPVVDLFARDFVERSQHGNGQDRRWRTVERLDGCSHHLPTAGGVDGDAPWPVLGETPTDVADGVRDVVQLEVHHHLGVDGDVIDRREAVLEHPVVDLGLGAGRPQNVEERKHRVPLHVVEGEDERVLLLALGIAALQQAGPDEFLTHLVQRHAGPDLAGQIAVREIPPSLLAVHEDDECLRAEIQAEACPGGDDLAGAVGDDVVDDRHLLVGVVFADDLALGDAPFLRLLADGDVGDVGLDGDQ